MHAQTLLLLCMFSFTQSALCMEKNGFAHVVVTPHQGDDEGISDTEDFTEQHSSFLDSQSPLLYFAKKNNISEAQKWLQTNTEVDILDLNNCTPLMVACALEQDSTEMVKLLLDKKANATFYDHNADTAAHYAALRNKPEILRLLQAAGASMLSKNNTHCTPFHFAAQHNAARAVAFLGLTKQGHYQVNAKGQIPIHVAVSYKCKDALFEILSSERSALYVTIAEHAPQITATIPAHSTVFHIAASDLSKEGYQIKCMLLYFALFKNSNFEKNGIFELHSLTPRIDQLRTAFKQLDCTGCSAYMLECKASKETNKQTHPLLFNHEVLERDGSAAIYKDKFKLDALVFHAPYTLENISKLPDSNIFKAAFLGMPQDAYVKHKGIIAKALSWFW